MKTFPALFVAPRFIAVMLLIVSLMGIPKVAACREGWGPGSQALPDTIAPGNEIAWRANQFGFRLYQQSVAATPDANQFLSPLSIFAALAMTAEGTAGSSLEAMRTTLGLPDQPSLHKGLSDLAADFTRKRAPYMLAFANAVWPEKTSPVRAEFLKTIENIYLGACIPQDFAGASEAARKTINQWVAQRTQQRIKELLPQGSVDGSTKMVLTNAVYFKANWKTKFDKALTETADFHKADGKTTPVQLMHRPSRNGALHYAEEADYQILELPYEGDDMHMTILLPKAGKMADLEALLDEGLWDLARNKMQSQKVDVWLPRFKMEIGGSIKPLLAQMGMAPLFQSADFSNMFQHPTALVISDVFHKTFVEVNEAGTEAAAATAVVVNKSAPSAPIPSFRADRPFLFAIQHGPSHTVLFMGKVMHPGV